MDKQVLREVYRRTRLAMSRAEVQTKSRIIGRRLLSETDWQHIKTVCIYSPISRLNEVDIKGIGAIMRKHGVKVHVLEASRSARIPAKKFDLIIVPCLAVDKDNYRLGWGSGYYDRFLARQPQALKIGLCYRNGLVTGGLPRESHDIPLDKVITEV